MNDPDDSRRDDDRFAARAAERFHESVAGLDAATRSRLNRARQRALRAGRQPRFRLRQAFLPAAATAATATAVVFLLWGGNEVRELPPAAVAGSDLEMLMDRDDFEMLQELEFYSWMELDEEGAGDNVG